MRALSRPAWSVGFLPTFYIQREKGFLWRETDRQTDRQTDRDIQRQRQRDRDRETETERQRETETETDNSNSKTLILKDSSVRSIWTYLTASPCYTTNTNKHDNTINKEREREREREGGRGDRQTDRQTDG